MPKVGRFGPPPSLPFGSVRGGRVRSVWSRPAFGPHPFLGTVSCGLVPGSVAPWSPLAGSSTGCCGTASVSRVRSCAQLTRFSASLATYRSRLAQVSDRWRAPVAKLAPGGAPAAPPFWFGVRTLGIRPSPPLSVGRRRAPSARRRGWRGPPPGSPGGPCAGLVVGAFRSSRRPPGRALAYG